MSELKTRSWQPDHDSVMSIDKAAHRLGIHRDTLRRRAREGQIKILQLSARRIGIRESEFQRYLAENETR
jgi:excisionase family DNA binding protein